MRKERGASKKTEALSKVEASAVAGAPPRVGEIKGRIVFLEDEVENGHTVKSYGIILKIKGTKFKPHGDDRNNHKNEPKILFNINGEEKDGQVIESQDVFIRVASAFKDSGRNHIVDNLSFTITNTDQVGNPGSSSGPVTAVVTPITGSPDFNVE